MATNNTDPGGRLDPERRRPPAAMEEGRCSCCPYGYHIDLDFLEFCRNISQGSTLAHLKRIQRTKRRLRKSMELMLQGGGDPASTALPTPPPPPDVVHSTEASRLMRMVSYEHSATDRVLRDIDSAVDMTLANIDGMQQRRRSGRSERRYTSTDSEGSGFAFSPHARAGSSSEDFDDKLSSRHHSSGSEDPAFASRHHSNSTDDHKFAFRRHPNADRDQVDSRSAPRPHSTTDDASGDYTYSSLPARFLSTTATTGGNFNSSNEPRFSAASDDFNYSPVSPLSTTSSQHSHFEFPPPPPAPPPRRSSLRYAHGAAEGDGAERGRADSFSSVSSVSTVSSERPLSSSGVNQENQPHRNGASVLDKKFVVSSSCASSSVAGIQTLAAFPTTAPHPEVHMTSESLAATMATHFPPPRGDQGEGEGAPLSPMSPVTPISKASLAALRSSLTLSLQRLRDLEQQVKVIPVLQDQVKAIPILQVRLSVLKEEKRLLALQLKAKAPPPASTSLTRREEEEEPASSPPSLPSPSFSFAGKTPGGIKTPPPTTLPKPRRGWVEVGVGEHSVWEPYVLQPLVPVSSSRQRCHQHCQTEKAVFEETDAIRNTGCNTVNVYTAEVTTVNTGCQDVETASPVPTLGVNTAPTPSFNHQGVNTAPTPVVTVGVNTAAPSLTHQGVNTRPPPTITLGVNTAPAPSVAHQGVNTAPTPTVNHRSVNTTASAPTVSVGVDTGPPPAVSHQGVSVAPAVNHQGVNTVPSNSEKSHTEAAVNTEKTDGDLTPSLEKVSPLSAGNLDANGATAEARNLCADSAVNAKNLYRCDAQVNTEESERVDSAVNTENLCRRDVQVSTEASERIDAAVNTLDVSPPHLSRSGVECVSVSGEEAKAPLSPSPPGRPLSLPEQIVRRGADQALAFLGSTSSMGSLSPSSPQKEGPASFLKSPPGSSSPPGGHSDPFEASGAPPPPPPRSDSATPDDEGSLPELKQAETREGSVAENRQSSSRDAAKAPSPARKAKGDRQEEGESRGESRGESAQPLSGGSSRLSRKRVVDIRWSGHHTDPGAGVYSGHRVGSVEDFMPKEMRQLMNLEAPARAGGDTISSSQHGEKGEAVAVGSLQSELRTSIEDAGEVDAAVVEAVDNSEDFDDAEQQGERATRSPRTDGSADKSEHRKEEHDEEEEEEEFFEAQDEEEHYDEDSDDDEGSGMGNLGKLSAGYLDLAHIDDDEDDDDKSPAEECSDSIKDSGYEDSSLRAPPSDSSSVDSHSMGSLERRQLKSIMKTSGGSKASESSSTGQPKKGITFADSVVGGTGSSSEEQEQDDEEEEKEEEEEEEEAEEEGSESDEESTTSFEEGSYDGRAGDITYRCHDDEAIAKGLPGAKMFDQNIRQTYELSAEMSQSCGVVARYLVDSTTIQTKELSAHLSVVSGEWFRVSSHKLSAVHQVEDYLSSIKEVSPRLLQYIVNLMDSNGNAAIHYCVSHCNFDLVGLLLDTEVCDVKGRNKAGYTPAMLASLAFVQNEAHRSIIRRLFMASDVNARADKTGQTALMLATGRCAVDMVDLLLEAGADVNVQDLDGSTALMCACEHGHANVVSLLLTHPSCDATLTDNEQSTALSIAMEAGHRDIGVILYKHLNFQGSQKRRKGSSSPTPRYLAQ